VPLGTFNTIHISFTTFIENSMNFHDYFMIIHTFFLLLICEHYATETGHKAFEIAPTKKTFAESGGTGPAKAE
jgi:hypothetical protein